MSKELLLEPVLLDIASGEKGFSTPVPRPLLRVIKVQGVNMRDPSNTPDEPTKLLYAYRMFVTDGKYTMFACLNPAIHFYIHLMVLTKGTYFRALVYDVRTEMKKASDKKFTRYLVINDISIEYSPTFEFLGDSVDLEDARIGFRENGSSAGSSIAFSGSISSSDEFEPKVLSAVPSSISPTPPTSAQLPHTSPTENEVEAGSQRNAILNRAKNLKHPRDEGDADNVGDTTKTSESPQPLKIDEDARSMPPPPLPHPRPDARQLRPRTMAQMSSTRQSLMGSSFRSQPKSVNFKYPSQPPQPSLSQSTAPGITPLGQLINIPVARRVNVLVVVKWVSDKTITRAIGTKRDMELLDQTSDRPTRLSVWLDLESFIPRVGDIVLFRGLYVHKFDGRSLNAFPELQGTAWHQSEPDTEQAAELRAWYRSKLEGTK